MKKRLIPFKFMPAAWGLRGEAYAVAEAHYYYDGEKLERELATIKHAADPKMLQRVLIDIDFRYHHINAQQRDYRLADLEIEDLNLRTLRHIEIDALHGAITPYDAAVQRVNLTVPAGLERELRLLEVEHKFGRINRFEYDKRCATRRNEPWVAIVNSNFDAAQGIDGIYFEFDWNDQWIEFLKAHGYNGHSQEQIVDEWFTDVCRSHSAAEFAGAMAPGRHLLGRDASVIS